MKELSLNRKIEQAIRFNDFNEAIRLCTIIAEEYANIKVKENLKKLREEIEGLPIELYNDGLEFSIGKEDILEIIDNQINDINKE